MNEGGIQHQFNIFKGFIVSFACQFHNINIEDCWINSQFLKRFIMKSLRSFKFGYLKRISSANLPDCSIDISMFSGLLVVPITITCFLGSLSAIPLKACKKSASNGHPLNAAIQADQSHQ